MGTHVCEIAAKHRSDNSDGDARDAISAAGEGVVTSVRGSSSSDRNGRGNGSR